MERKDNEPKEMMEPPSEKHSGRDAGKLDRYIHRDLSWLAFNRRVLEEAEDPRSPLLERLRFLGICSNNLDEFFMVRVAGLRRLLDAGYNRRDGFGQYPQDLYEEVRRGTEDVLARAHGLLRTDLAREMERQRISVLSWGGLSADQKKAARRYFESTLFPIATPLAIDQSHPFPVLHSKTNTFCVRLERGGQESFALIILPESVARTFRLPSEKDECRCILIDDIIREHLGQFFRGYTVKGSFVFRIIRDSELAPAEEYASDLLKVIEREVRKRPAARVVCLQAERSADGTLLDRLCEGLGFDRELVSLIDGTLDLTFLFALVRQAGRPALQYPSFAPARLAYDNIFDRIAEGEFIVHLPFESFQPTVDLIAAAARDPGVLAIKMTLYRTSEDSSIIKALIEAAKAGKQVAVLVELTARFDEERNIGWTRELEAAGCHVVYGVPGLKVHAKILLIVRDEQGRIARYLHLSTGNYNEKTAAAYTDLGYFTANEDLARDASDVFNAITGYSQPAPGTRIVTAPRDMRSHIAALIGQEIAFQKRGRNGMIFAKLNSLEDPGLIDLLYQASSAGVKVRLLVRGICCLRPGIAGLSEHIEVKSIVGRFLEHTRVISFHNNGEPRLFLSSADWMTRNLDRRVELLFEMRRDEIRRELAGILECYWKDTAKSRVLGGDGLYCRPPDGERSFNAQEYLIEHYSRPAPRAPVSLPVEPEGRPVKRAAAR